MDLQTHHDATRKPATVDPSELLTAAETTDLLRLKPQTLAVWRVERRGPRWLKIGRRVYYRSADINAWLATQLCEVA